MCDQNVPCAVQHRPQWRVAFFFTHADAVAHPGIEAAEIAHREGAHIALPLADRPLRFGQKLKRLYQLVDPVSGREFLQAHAAPETLDDALRPVAFRRMKTGLPGSLRTSNPPELVTSALRLRQP